MPNILAENISKRYNNIQALLDVTLEVKDGEYLTIVGPSGCGKTTLIKIIAGIVKSDKGEVSINGKKVTNLQIEERGLGYVFQEIALFPHMSIWDNVSYGLMVKGKTQKERQGEVKQMLSMMSLEGYSKYRPGELSGGARQKTAIARALASGSNLLLLDEPLGALDLKVRTVLRYELQKLVKDLNLTAVHVTHDQEEALSISDRVVIMKAGRIVEVGKPRDLYLHPTQIFTMKFLGEATFMEGKVLEMGNSITIEVNGLELEAYINGSDINKGDKCVVAIRPEFVRIRIGEFKGKNNWLGFIRSVEFLGDAFRYEVDVDNGILVIVKSPIIRSGEECKKRDRVTLDLSVDQLLVFRHPGGDLSKELNLE